MPIPSANPRTVPERVFDGWFVKRIEIVAETDGTLRREVHFFRSHDTGEPLTEKRTTTDEDGNETTKEVPRLDHHGSQLTRKELLPESHVKGTVEDLYGLARERAAAGDTSVRDIIDQILNVEASYNMEKGVIE